MLNGELHTNEVSKDYPNLGKTTCVFQLCVFPNRWCANGVPFHAISYSELRHFKRISKDKFIELCPDFGQLRHFGDVTLKSINQFHEILSIPKRKESFGN